MEEFAITSKKDQRALLTVQSFALLGQGLIGVFFPFFVQRSYGLNDWQLIIWFACLQLAMAFIIFPLNYVGVKWFGIRRVVQLGIFFQALFYALLGLGITTLWSFILLNISFLLFISLFWPGFNYLSSIATTNGDRGNYFGSLQVVMVSVSLVAPVLTGFLLEWQQERWVLLLSIISFLIALSLVRMIPKTGAEVSSLKLFKAQFFRIFFTKRNFPAFLADSIITNTMWVLWPLYFKAVVGSFSVMGIITAATALLEMFTAKFFGRLADKKSAHWLLQSGAWARCIDLMLRAVYFKFNHLYVVLGIQSLGAVFGPWFNISAGTRIFEVGEEQSENMLDFLLGREVFLGFFRFIWFLPMGILVYYTDVIYLAIAFVIAGLTALAFRRL